MGMELGRIERYGRKIGSGIKERAKRRGYKTKRRQRAIALYLHREELATAIATMCAMRGMDLRNYDEDVS